MDVSAAVREFGRRYGIDGPGLDLSQPVALALDGGCRLLLDHRAEAEALWRMTLAVRDPLVRPKQRAGMSGALAALFIGAAIAVHGAVIATAFVAGTAFARIPALPVYEPIEVAIRLTSSIVAVIPSMASTASLVAP